MNLAEWRTSILALAVLLACVATGRSQDSNGQSSWSSHYSGSVLLEAGRASEYVPSAAAPSRYGAGDRAVLASHQQNDRRNPDGFRRDRAAPVQPASSVEASRRNDERGVPSLRAAMATKSVLADVDGEVIYQNDGGLPPAAVYDPSLSEGEIVHGEHFAAVGGPAPTYSTGTSYWAGRFYTQQDVMVWTKENAGAATLAFDGGLVGTPTFNNFQDQPGYEPGARITFGYMLGRDHLNRDHMVEFTWLGAFDWTSFAIFDSANPGFIDTLLGPNQTVPPGFEDADFATYLYDSDLNSYELNFRIRTRPRRDRLILQPDGRWIKHGTPSRIWSYLGGFRVISDNEQFVYRSFDLADPSESIHSVTTHNDMFGVQLGVECLEKHTEWSYGLRGKLGGLVNFADRRTFTYDQATSVSQVVDDEHLAVMIEAGLFVAYQVRPNMALRMSYDVLFINGVARAPENLGIFPNSFRTFDTSGSELFQGLSFGYEMVW